MRNCVLTSLVHCHIYPFFLASAVGVKATFVEILGLEHENGKYNDMLELGFDSAEFEVAPVAL